MDIQKSDYECDPCGPSNRAGGGNRTLVNQDEDDAPAAQFENIPVVGVTDPMYVCDDSHLQGAYRGKGY